MTDIVMRYDCGRQGCFNEHRRLKFAAFKPALDRAGVLSKISFSDIDGMLEVGGHFLFVEWKGDGVDVSRGQSLAFERLTKLNRKITAFMVEGDASDMTVSSWSVVSGGRVGLATYGGLDDLNGAIEAWAFDALHQNHDRRRLGSPEVQRPEPPL